MHNWDPLWLVLAGVGAGLSGSVAGLASMISYPALLAVGVPPVGANVTNTVALVFSGAGSVSGSRPELRGQRQLARRLAPVALVGGGTGAVLLLATPAGLFARIVPVLIGLASLAVLLRHRPVATVSPPAADHRGQPVPGGQTLPEPRGRWVEGGVFAITLYGGYFGAAAGVAMLALLLAATGQALRRCAAMRNVVMAVANGVAAIGFALFGPVHWLDALPLALGFLAGGRAGPVVLRHLPAWPLRVFIACAGVALAVHLGLDAYR